MENTSLELRNLTCPVILDKSQLYPHLSHEKMEYILSEVLFSYKNKFGSMKNYWRNLIFLEERETEFSEIELLPVCSFGFHV